MKSIRLHGMRDVRIYDEPIPIADAGEKLVRIKAVAFAIRTCMGSWNARLAMQN
jgi:hypothetical protein